MILELFSDILSYFRRLGCKGRLAHDVNLEVYHLETGVSLVTCINSTSLQDLQCRFSHPTLQVLKKLVPKLGHMSSFECE